MCVSLSRSRSSRSLEPAQANFVTLGLAEALKPLPALLDAALPAIIDDPNLPIPGWEIAAAVLALQHYSGDRMWEVLLRMVACAEDGVWEPTPFRTTPARDLYFGYWGNQVLGKARARERETPRSSRAFPSLSLSLSVSLSLSASLERARGLVLSRR